MSTSNKTFRLAKGLAAAAAGLAGLFLGAAAYAADGRPNAVRLEAADDLGQVYADPAGKTLYTWREDSDVTPKCDGTRYSEIKGAGSLKYSLPDQGIRRTCQEVWPPFIAAADAKPVGDWTIVARSDGSKQWAYKKKPLYTYLFDAQPGEVNGMRERFYSRSPVVASSELPSGLMAGVTPAGRMLMTVNGQALYFRNAESLSKISCVGDCLNAWKPLAAPEIAAPLEGWTIAVRSDGGRQWAYRGKPLYIYTPDSRFGDMNGTSQPGWQPAVLQAPLSPPKDITVQYTGDGPAFADRRGMTLYTFSCVEEAPDRGLCDVPGSTQVYRQSICGQPATCAANWKPVVASKDAKPVGHTWSVITVDPTGKYQYAAPGQTDGLRVWAYRGRPVYTYAKDNEPGDMNGHNVAALGSWGYYMLRVPGTEKSAF